MTKRRAILIVMDGCGAGALPDAAGYGEADPGSNTLYHVISRSGLSLPALESLGLYAVLGMVSPEEVIGGHGRCAEMSKGKDSVTGHWEMMGIITDNPFPTYPHGFPPEVMTEFERRIGRCVIGNVAASGTEIIARLGTEHVATGKPIVYTSADSVFQVAAHESVIPVEQLHRMCAEARRMLIAPNNVQRVIARPFVGNAASGFTRTDRRRDFPLPPPEPNILTALAAAGKTVHGIGVVVELFPKSYFTVAQRTRSNSEHLAAILRAVQHGDADFVFANCEDFDMLYGHRNDTPGFAAALVDFDRALAEILAALRPADLLMICADHGNDPTTPSTDHSREYVPLLIFDPSRRKARALGDLKSMADIGATASGWLGTAWSGPGVPVRTP